MIHVFVSEIADGLGEAVLEEFLTINVRYLHTNYCCCRLFSGQTPRFELVNQSGQRPEIEDQRCHQKEKRIKTLRTEPSRQVRTTLDAIRNIIHELD